MKNKTRQTIAYFSTFFLLGAVIASLGPTLPDLAENLGREVSELSLLFSTRSMGYLFGALLTGVMLERLSGHTYLAGGLLLTAALLATVPYLQTRVLLLGALFLIGLSLGSFDVSSNTLLAHVHGENSGPYLNAMYLSAGVGSTLIPLYLGAVSWKIGYISLGLLLLPLLGWMLLTPAPELSREEGTADPLFEHFLILLLFSLLSFLYVGLEVSYGGWVFTYFQALSLGPDQAAYTLTAVFWIAITVGRLLAIFTALHIKPVLSIFLYLCGGLSSTLLILLFQHQSWAIWAGTGGIGLSLAALFPTTFNYIQRTNRFSSRLNGIVWSIGSLGGILLPYLIGRGLRRAGPTSMMVIILISWTIALLLYAALIGKNRQLPLLEDQPG